MIAALLISLLLPWACGALLVWRVLGKAESNLPLILGLGYFTGYFVLTITMRWWDPANSAVNFYTLLIPLTVLGSALLLLPNKPHWQSWCLPTIHADQLRHWQTWIVSILLCMIALRYYTLAQELALRPVFPWDAFDSWVQRAQEWYLQNPSPAMTYDKVNDVWSYGPREETFGGHPHPYTVSLISLWGMLAVGAIDAPLANIYWVTTPLAIGLMVYGYLRLQRCGVLPCTIGLYLITSIPYLNVHTALAGYADVWMTGALSGAALCLYLWRSKHRWCYLTLGVLLLAFAVSIKRTGLWLALITLTALFISSISKQYLLAMLAAALVTAVSLMVFLIAGSQPIDLLGLATIDPNSLTVNVKHLGTLNSVNVARILPPLAETLLQSRNWHTLIFLVASIMLLPLLNRCRTSALRREEWMIPAAIYLSLASIFAFSDKYFGQAESFTTLNRTLLYGMPLLIVMLARLTCGNHDDDSESV